MCGNAAWIATGRTRLDGGVMLKTGTGRLSIKTWGPPTCPDAFVLTVVTDDVVVLLMDEASAARTGFFLGASPES
jgi:hypothetical protein